MHQQKLTNDNNVKYLKKRSADNILDRSIKRQKVTNEKPTVKHSIDYSTNNILNTEIMWYLIHNNFIDHDCFLRIFLTCKSINIYMNIYTKYFNQINNNFESEFTKVSSSIDSKSKVETKKSDIIIDIIRSITSEDIINGFTQTGVSVHGIDTKNPTGCCVYAVSLYYTLTRSLYTKLKTNRTFFRFTLFDHRNCAYQIGKHNAQRIGKIIKYWNNNNMAYIFNFHVSWCYLYKQRDVIVNQNVDNDDDFEDLDIDTYTEAYANANVDPKTYIAKTFPGHVFAIVKTDINEYVLTQSYINLMTHIEHIKVLTLQDVIDIYDKYTYICNCRIIDQQFVDFWKYITNVDISMLKGWGFLSLNDHFRSSVFFMDFMF